MSVSAKINAGERTAAIRLIGRLIILDEKLQEEPSQRHAIESFEEGSQRSHIHCRLVMSSLDKSPVVTPSGIPSASLRCCTHHHHPTHSTHMKIAELRRTHVYQRTQRMAGREDLVVCRSRMAPPDPRALKDPSRSLRRGSEGTAERGNWSC